MSEFLFIAPEGWTQLDYEELVNSGDLTPYIKDILHNTYEVTELLVQAGAISPEQYVNEAKVIDDKYLWVLLG